MDVEQKPARKILLHCCCAPCACYPLQFLKLLNYKQCAYFYNPNITDSDEYKKRVDEFVKYCKKYNFEYILENYNKDEFYEISSGLENCPEKGERCLKCFELRINKTAKKAKELFFDCFSTTLTISPHKDSKAIFEISQNAAKNFGVEFAEFDFKKNNGYKVSREIVKFNNIYTQNYCGCEFSKR
jgi:predicted adenine nucleotide alpha hydrolase (AANH) superfamily ATPase